MSQRLDVDAQLRALRDVLYGENAHRGDAAIVTEAEELFAALDEHLSRGGELPKAWQPTRAAEEEPDTCHHGRTLVCPDCDL